MQKKAPQVIPWWQERWFELEDRRLRYYDTSNNQMVMKGVLNFDLYSVRIEMDKNDTELKVMIENCQREFRLKPQKGESKADLAEWALALNKHIHHSKGY